MAGKYKASVVGVASDGTNLFVKVSVSNGETTMETVEHSFPIDTAASFVKTYVQAIADNTPTISADHQLLVGYTATQS